MAKKQGHQLDRLVEEALAIQEQDALDANAIGYYTRVLCQISMPVNPWPDNEFERDSGKVHISISAPRKIGVPWGIYPRGILCWITTDVVHRKDDPKENTRIVQLGDNLGEFITKVSGSESFSGGETGNLKRFKRQLMSTLASRIYWWFGDENEPDPSDPFRSMEVASSGNVMWHPKLLNQPGLFSSTIELGEKFHDDIIEHAVPIDTRALRGLWPSCLAVDLYTWATYRAFTMQKVGRRQLELSWGLLRVQFGPQYGDLKHFKPNFRDALKRVKMVYEDFEYDEGEKGFVFKMKRPSVRRVFKVNGVRHQLKDSTDVHA